jgi:hypothetical protein
MAGSCHRGTVIVWFSSGEHVARGVCHASEEEAEDMLKEQKKLEQSKDISGIKR